MKRTARPSVLVLILLPVLALLPLTACGGTPQEEARGPIADAPMAGDVAAGETAAGDPKTGFRLTSLGGDRLGPPDFADHVVLVDFWATWCVPCHAQAEVLKEVYAGLDDDDRVQFLAVDVGETETQVRGFVEKNPFPYPVLLDSESRTADSLGVYSLPTLMIVDRRGEVSYFKPGMLGKGELCRELETAGAAQIC